MLDIVGVSKTFRTGAGEIHALSDASLTIDKGERASTYSPFLPVSPRSGKVLQVAIVDRDPAAGTISYDDPDTGERISTPVTGGHCKLQWKPDWAMRWVALGVDYETKLDV